MEFIDETERRQKRSPAQPQLIREPVLEVREFEKNLVGVLDFDLGVEEKPIVEFVTDLDNRPKSVELIEPP